MNLQKGFSLLETLIASAIFAAVLLIASSAFKFFMSSSERPVNSETVMSDAMRSIELRNSIKGLHHYLIKEAAITNESAKLFFQGSENGFTGITESAIEYSSQPTRITVSLDPKGKKLIYCEFDNSKVFPIKNMSTDCKTPHVLSSNIEDAKFSYFGWSTLDHLYGIARPSNAFAKEKMWARLWDGSIRGVLPQYIRIDISYDELGRDYQPTQLWFKVADTDPIQYHVNKETGGV